MPVYEYECRDHGLFELIKSVSQCREPAPCPACALPGARILSAPHLSALPRAQLLARDRNERSCHEPRVARTPGGEQARGASTPPKLRPYHGRRPWVIEHS